jgi:hypothetical protein
MTERNTFRRAIALVGMLSLCGCALSVGALLNAGSAALVTRFDANGDGGLDRDEVAKMVATSAPGQGADLDALRAGLAAGYWTRDCDRDGRLTAAELAAGNPCG